MSGRPLKGNSENLVVCGAGCEPAANLQSASLFEGESEYLGYRSVDIAARPFTRRAGSTGALECAPNHLPRHILTMAPYHERMKAAAFAAVLLLCSCSDTTTTKETKAPEPPPEPTTGRHAFQQTYPQARLWAVDAAPEQVKSINLSQVKSADGKAGAWQVVYYSPSLARTKTYTWSAVEAEGNLHKGVFAGPDESARPQKTFLLAGLRVDSDEAYKVAAAKSADYMKKHPNMPVMFILEMNNRFPQLTWRVVWGETLAGSDYSVFVDAANGQFLEKAH
jgi:hypothetical protein